jgi:uncharacterized protein YkwD
LTLTLGIAPLKQASLAELRTASLHADLSRIDRTPLFALSAAALLVTSLWVAPAGASRPRASGARSAAATATANAERLIRRCANHQRAMRGIPALRVDTSLGRAARAHARAMLEQGFFDHTDPQGRGPRDRVARLSSRRWIAVGENIAAGFRDAGRTCARWNHAHRANMLKRSYTHIGAGYAHGPRGYGRYYVQVFGTLAR